MNPPPPTQFLRQCAISNAGNLADNDHVALILIDWANRMRFKVGTRAQIVYAEDKPQLQAPLEAPKYRAKVERAVMMSFETVDWNCVQYSTPRYTECEIEQLATSIQNRITETEALAAASVQMGLGGAVFKDSARLNKTLSRFIAVI